MLYLKSIFFYSFLKIFLWRIFSYKFLIKSSFFQNINKLAIIFLSTCPSLSLNFISYIFWQEAKNNFHSSLWIYLANRLYINATACNFKSNCNSSSFLNNIPTLLYYFFLSLKCFIINSENGYIYSMEFNFKYLEE